jgi:hypothetical protein
VEGGAAEDPVCSITEQGHINKQKKCTSTAGSIESLKQSQDSQNHQKGRLSPLSVFLIWMETGIQSGGTVFLILNYKGHLKKKATSSVSEGGKGGKKMPKNIPEGDKTGNNGKILTKSAKNGGRGKQGNC